MQPDEPEITNHKQVTDNSANSNLNVVETLLSSAGFNVDVLNVKYDVLKIQKNRV